MKSEKNHEETNNRTVSRREFMETAGAITAAAALSLSPRVWGADAAAPAGTVFAQEPLPYAFTALEPWISVKTLDLHYNKHHKAYVDNLNKRLAFQKLSYPSLTAVILDKKGTINLGEAVYTMAVLSWNHDFYWKSMSPTGGKIENYKFQKLLSGQFGSIENFRAKFLEEAMKIGVGWVWLVKEGDTLNVVRTEYHDSPLVHNQVPLLVCDVWEHAYYIDYQNRRDDYVNDWLSHLANWEFAEKNFGIVK